MACRRGSDVARAVVLEAAGCANQSNPWRGYAAHLTAIAKGDPKDDRMVRGTFSREWAIGTAAWRKALARDHAHLALAPELSQSEVRELQSERWERALELALKEIDRSPAELASAPKSAPWKRALAHTLRDAVAPPSRWLAEKLCMGKPGSVRAYVHSAGLAVVCARGLTIHGLTPLARPPGLARFVFRWRKRLQYLLRE